jgi:hypothetical protein
MPQRPPTMLIFWAHKGFQGRQHFGKAFVLASYPTRINGCKEVRLWTVELQ